jgi:hypothetical protein
MDGTIIGQGSFNAAYTLTNPNPGVAEDQAGNAVNIAIPSGADWVKVYNYTKAGANGNSAAYFQGTANAVIGIEFYWQRGMAAGTGIARYKSNAAATLNEDTFVTGGFTLLDTSIAAPGAPVATTASTNATQPVVSTANTAGLSIGSIVRMSNTAQTDVNGIDMVVGAVTANTNFTLLTATNALANVPGAIGGAGFYRIIPFDPIFYPRRRFITNITQATNGQVSTSVPHGLTVGQEVRFEIPNVSGMIQLNSTSLNNYLAAIIVTVVDDYNFTININTTAFTAFTFPTIAQQPSSFPIVVPFGEDTATSINSIVAQTPSVGGVQIFNTNTGLLADSTVNTAYIGMTLGSGGNGLALTTPITGPAGTVHFASTNLITTTDVMYWVAGKSTYGGL